MITWASLVVKALGLLSTILTWAKEEQQRGIGRKEAIHRALEAALQGIKLAEEAREKVVSDIAARPDSLREDDGFRRPAEPVRKSK